MQFLLYMYSDKPACVTGRQYPFAIVTEPTLLTCDSVTFAHDIVFSVVTSTFPTWLMSTFPYLVGGYIFLPGWRVHFPGCRVHFSGRIGHFRDWPVQFPSPGWRVHLIS